MESDTLYFGTYRAIDFDSLPDTIPESIYRLAVHHLIERQWYERNGTDFNRVNRSYKQLEQVHHLLPKTFLILFGEGIIERDNYCNPDYDGSKGDTAKPYSYWFPQNIKDSGFQVESINSTEVHPQRWESLQQYHTIERDYDGHDKLYSFLSELSIEPDDVDGFNPFAFHILNGSHLFRRRWVRRNGSLSDGRLHSSFSLLPRSLKGSVKLKRSPDLVEVDISCSHGFLLAMLLTGKLQKCKTAALDSLTRSLSPSSPSKYPLVYDREGVQDNTHLPDYIHHAVKGTLYEEIQEMMEGVYENPTRNQAKRLFNELLNVGVYDFVTYEVNGTEHFNNKRHEVLEKIMDRWSTVMETIIQEGPLLGTRLMQIEAGLMIDTVSSELEKYGFPFQCTHDGIYVGWNRAELVKDTIESIFINEFGMTPKVKIKEK